MGIVVSNGYALSASGVDEGWKPIIGWRSVIGFGNITADSERADYPATNLTNKSTAELWKSDSTDLQYVTSLFDAATIDYAGIAEHNFGSGQVTFSVEGLPPGGDPDDDGDWIDLAGDKLPARDGHDVFRFVPTILTGLRLKLQPTTVKPQAAVFKGGDLIVLQKGLSPGHVPISYGREVSAASLRSQGGDHLGRVVLTESLSSDIVQQNLDPDWYRSTLEPFRKASDNATFFFAWNPRDYPDEVGYCEVTNSPRPAMGAEEEINITFEIAGTI